MQQHHSTLQQKCRLGDNCRISIKKSGDQCAFGRRTKVIGTSDMCSLGQQSEFIYSEGASFGSDAMISHSESKE